MTKFKKIPNRYAHGSYGTIAAIKFFGRWFRIPLHTEDDMESRRRFDIAATQLADFFEEPRTLLVPEFREDYAKVARVNRIWDSFETDAGFNPCIKNQEAFKVEKDREEIDTERNLPSGHKWTTFLWCLRRSQCQVEKYCKDLGIEPHELANKRQELLKRWPEVLKLRAAHDSFTRRKKVDNALHYIQSLAVGPKNLGAQLVYAQKCIESLQYLKEGDRGILKELFERAVPSVQALEADCSEILKAATSACLGIRNYSE